MAATPGLVAFIGYVNAAGIEGALPWADQDQRVWEKAATSTKVEAPEVADESPAEMPEDALVASAEGE